MFFIWIYLNAIYFCDGKSDIFKIITPVFSVTWSFKKPFWHASQKKCFIVKIKNINLSETIIHFFFQDSFGV